ncbi:preprotein translocase subunit SecG [Novilysobacter erysipheiresistens]|uniref:Protein-export membrane protein SecG n=1 Tax=Novilysobacter erysipheiresistens TaxID=1749332 RepID=A0ABU7YV80_9GAMM
MLLFLTVIYVLVAIAMIALILMQRGAGAQAGSGFGGGASATVFGARGASSFLSKSTKWLAIVFFSISMYMAWHATNSTDAGNAASADLGVMSQVPVAPPAAQGDAAVPATPVAVPQAPAVDSSVPAAPATETPQSAPPETTDE